MLGQRTLVEGRQGPNALQSVEGIRPLPPQIGESQTPMDTPLQARQWVAGVGAEATGGVGKGNSWCQQDWICRSSS